MTSRAFVHSIVTRAGYVLSSPTLDYGIDASITQVRERLDAAGPRLVEGFEFKVQIKASVNIEVEEGHDVYDLEAKAYNDLVEGIDIDYPLDFNIRLPSGFEEGANKLFEFGVTREAVCPKQS
jgi:hypothetical protein